MARRPVVDPADRGVADAALGHVDDPLDAHLVGRVGDGPEVGDRVLDLAPVVEPRAADHLVRDAHAHEVLLEHAALRVGAVEDGDVAPSAMVVVVQLRDRVRDPLRLVALVVGVVAHDRIAVP